MKIMLVAAPVTCAWLCAACAVPHDLRRPAYEPGLRQGRHYYAAGEYQRSVESYQAAAQQYPGEKAVLNEYVKTLEEIKRLADEAAARGDCLKAGNGYAALWKAYPAAEKLGSPLSFSKGSVDEGLRKCRAHLTQKGLEMYRHGYFREAISLWQDLLKFDPENGEIRKAVDTAIEQLKELEKK